MNPTLAELYERYEECVATRDKALLTKKEAEAAEVICNETIVAVQAEIQEWYARKNLVMIDIADKEKEF